MGKKRGRKEIGKKAPSQSSNLFPNTLGSQLEAIAGAFESHAMSEQGQQQHFDDIPLGDVLGQLGALHASGQISDETDVAEALSMLQIGDGNLEVTKLQPATVASTDIGGEQASQASLSRSSVGQPKEDEPNEISDKDINDLWTLWERGIIGPDTPEDDPIIHEALAELYKEQEGQKASPSADKQQSSIQSVAPSVQSLSQRPTPQENSSSVSTTARASQQKRKKRTNQKKKHGRRR